MSNSEYRPRLSIDVTYEQMTTLGEVLPWGTKNKVFGVLIDSLIEILQGENRSIILGAILNQDLDALDILKLGGK